MSSHIDALDFQAELLHFWRGPAGKQFARSTAEFVQGFGADEIRWVYSETAQREGAILRAARTFWVHHDMCALTEHAGLTMPVETLEPEDLPAPCGFAVFEQPVIFGEVHIINPVTKQPGPPELIRVGHFSWGPSPHHETMFGPGVHLAFYEPRGARDRPSLPGLANQYYWPFGESDDEEGATSTGMRQTTKALWALCQQRIGEPSPAVIDRSTRRRVARVELPAEVQIVHLRRQTPAPTQNTGSGVDWKKRWIVHGFWRNQWYPSVEKHRQIWIDDYVKGPDDKPLVIKDPVYRVDR
jgi:hypothetical protein